jgi:hypothetical protein
MSGRRLRLELDVSVLTTPDEEAPDMAQSPLLPVHWICELWPRMSPEEHAGLVQNMRTYGWLEGPIRTIDGKVFDGKNRQFAAAEAGIEAKYEAFEGTEDEALAIAITLNHNRRNMTEEQRRATRYSLACRASKRATAVRGRKQASGAMTIEEAAKLYGVSVDDIGAARAIEGRGTEAQEKLAESGVESLRKLQDAIIRSDKKGPREKSSYSGKITHSESISDVADRLEESYADGHKHSIYDVARACGVAPSAVRNALARLEKRGYQAEPSLDGNEFGITRIEPPELEEERAGRVLAELKAAGLTRELEAARAELATAQATIAELQTEIGRLKTSLPPDADAAPQEERGTRH